MMPCNDPSGLRTARWTTWHAAVLTTLPFIAVGSGVTSSMFLFEGCVLNAGGMFVAYKFLQRPAQPSAKRVFFYSLVYLPLLLAGLVFHSKRWEQNAEDCDTLLVVDESTGVSTRRPRAPATLADGVEGWRRAGRQICIHERGGREWVFSKIGCPYPFRKSSTATEASEGGV